MVALTVGAAGAGGAYDYTCDGTSDEVEINAAITTAGPGGSVALSAGTFACAADIALQAGRSLFGTAGTVLDFVTGATRRLKCYGTNTAGAFEIAGAGGLNVWGSDVTVSSVTSRQSVYGIGAFVIYANAKTIANVAFTDCDAIDTSGFGFLISGEGADPRVEGVTFTRCTATNCGLSYDNADAVAREWITGFDFAESPLLTIGDIHAIDCTATRCYESGFHCEFAPAIAAPCTITGCTATNCGNDKHARYVSDPGTHSDTLYGAGFLAPPSWTLTDCRSAGNWIGFRVGTHPDNPHTGELLQITRGEAIDPTHRGFHLGGAPDGPIVNAVLDQCTVSGVDAPNYYLYLGSAIGLRANDLRVIDCTGTVYEGPTSSDNAIIYYLEPFSVATAGPVTGETVTFTNRALGPTAWAWTFGDGDGSTLQNQTHAYPSAGVYPVTLAAGGNTVTQTVTVVPGVSYGGSRLSAADLGPLDHDPVANATRTKVGNVRLQGSPVSRRAWTINALADDHAEIDALAALKGQHLTLNINGVEYPGVMIRPPMLETQLTPSAWAYQIGFVQETRR